MRNGLGDWANVGEFGHRGNRLLYGEKWTGTNLFQKCGEWMQPQIKRFSQIEINSEMDFFGLTEFYSIKEKIHGNIKNTADDFKVTEIIDFDSFIAPKGKHGSVILVKQLEGCSQPRNYLNNCFNHARA